MAKQPTIIIGRDVREPRWAELAQGAISLSTKSNYRVVIVDNIADNGRVFDPSFKKHKWMHILKYKSSKTLWLPPRVIPLGNVTTLFSSMDRFEGTFPMHTDDTEKGIILVDKQNKAFLEKCQDAYINKKPLKPSNNYDKLQWLERNKHNRDILTKPIAEEWKPREIHEPNCNLLDYQDKEWDKVCDLLYAEYLEKLLIPSLRSK
jgi:hypothetical protein